MEDRHMGGVLQGSAVRNFAPQEEGVTESAMPCPYPASLHFVGEEVAELSPGIGERWGEIIFLRFDCIYSTLILLVNGPWFCLN